MFLVVFYVSRFGMFVRCFAFEECFVLKKVENSAMGCVAVLSVLLHTIVIK